MPFSIRALSFDADNCLFHVGYQPSREDIARGDSEHVITENQPLLDKLKSQNAAFKKTIVLTGSLRQSFEIDSAESKRNLTEPFFKAIPKIAHYLEATLDKFLTADIYANVESGTSFELAVNHPSKKQNTCMRDESKLSILYAQTHKLANQYPDESILFEFYDDRGCGVWEVTTDLLETLHAYFTLHADMLPCNVTLRLNHYEGTDVTPYSDIQGTGFIDENYRRTTPKIATKALETWHSLMHITPISLRSRKPLDTAFRLSDFPHFLSLLRPEPPISPEDILLVP